MSIRLGFQIILIQSTPVNICTVVSATIRLLGGPGMRNQKSREQKNARERSQLHPTSAMSSYKRKDENNIIVQGIVRCSNVPSQFTHLLQVSAAANNGRKRRRINIQKKLKRAFCHGYPQSLARPRGVVAMLAASGDDTSVSHKVWWRHRRQQGWELAGRVSERRQCRLGHHLAVRAGAERGPAGRGEVVGVAYVDCANVEAL